MESEIHAVLRGEVSPGEALEKITLGHAVQKTILCPFSGTVLSVHTAVAIDTTESGGSGGGVSVMDGKTFDEVGADALLDALETRLGHDRTKIKIIDGRRMAARKQ
jgi:hypothetical protein